MCTVSWIFQDGGYELFFNRDEKRERARALAPRRSEQNGVAFVSPRDGDAGGTWIAANVYGIGLCLLNRYPDPKSGVFTSRGHLVRELADAGSAAEVEERLRRLEHDAGPVYRPFTLLALEPGEPPFVVAWDGERLLLPSSGPVRPPLSSSSYDPAGIGVSRRRLWESLFEGRSPSAEEAVEFHRSHRPERGPYSPCMHRDDARTVSFLRLRVTRSAVEMSYADGPPCRTELSQPLTLIRQPSRRPARHRLAPVV